LILDDAAQTVCFADPDMTLDVGAVGKGYAVEQAARATQARGFTSALLNVGGPSAPSPAESRGRRVLRTRGLMTLRIFRPLSWPMGTVLSSAAIISAILSMRACATPI